MAGGKAVPWNPKIGAVTARGVEIALSVTLAVTIANSGAMDSGKTMSPQEFRAAVRDGKIIPRSVEGNDGALVVAQSSFSNGGSNTFNKD